MPAGKTKEKNMIKARLIVLIQMFYEHTDQDNPMTIGEILEYLQIHNVPANEKTLRRDISLLQELGIDIIKIVSRPNLYYWGERHFEIPELKLLIDAVSSSRFITRKKSNELCKKITRLASENQRKELRRSIQPTNRIKTENESIYYSVDTINEAIIQRKKLQFQYTEYDPELNEILRGEGEIYEISPYALFWNEDYYYVVGWSGKHNNISVFRVDRIYKPTVLNERAKSKPKDFNLDDYSTPIFDMFEGVNRVPVKLEVESRLAKYIVDRFGKKLDTHRTSNDRFTVCVEVSLSPTFYAWIYQFDGAIKIISPESAKKDMQSIARKFIICQKK